MPIRPRPRHLIWILAAFLVSQIYIAREIIAALLVFTAIFVAVACVSAVVWLMRFIAARTVDWSESWLRGLRAAGARGALVFAEITRKSSRGTTAP